jgi:16S rRNA (cytosine967-C5)-methyltransferase
VTPGARVAAAIEVLTDVEARRRPVQDALKDWALSHRFAGSGDRAAIADRVYDALRTRKSAAWAADDDSPRAALLATVDPDVARSWAGDRHAPEVREAELIPPQSRAERLAAAPAWVRGDYPEWLSPHFERAFGDAAAEEGAALAARPPTDLRANTLTTTRDALLAALAEHPVLSRAAPGDVAPGRWSPDAVRLASAVDVRRFAPTATAEFLHGDYEIQDEGSQLAARLSGAAPGMQVGDLCAGAGGKTLALAALMGNRGQIFAHDIDARRLAKADERLRRAGVRNAQLRFPGPKALATCKARSTSPSSTPPAPAAAPGAATPTPSGACAPTRWTSAAANRPKRFASPPRW